ncbi:MAG: NAD(P)H-dependent oxidoreductase [Myxococcaceae bacterium]
MSIKVLAICGSGRAGSKTRRALEVAIQSAQKAGAEVTTLDLGEFRLPLFDGRVNDPRKPEVDVDPQVAKFRAMAKEADAFLIASPVYHDSYSGVLKNAIDFLYLELAEKVAGLIAVAGGRAGAGLALEHLRTVLRETQTWVVNRHVPIGNSDQSFDEAGGIKDPETVTRLSALGTELVLRTKLLRPRKAAPAAPPASAAS